jgi:hypothetical protein
MARMRGSLVEKVPRKATDEMRALERAVMAALLSVLEPTIERIVVTFRRELAQILERLDQGQTAPRLRGRLGRPKSCRVCRLEGARNDAALPANHTQQDHRRWRANAPLRAAGTLRASDPVAEG